MARKFVKPVNKLPILIKINQTINDLPVADLIANYLKLSLVTSGSDAFG
jgi:hypothetical protein